MNKYNRQIKGVEINQLKQERDGLKGRLDSLWETLVKVGDALSINPEIARDESGKPSDVYIQHIAEIKAQAVDDFVSDMVSRIKLIAPLITNHKNCISICELESLRDNGLPKDYVSIPVRNLRRIEQVGDQTLRLTFPSCRSASEVKRILEAGKGVNEDEF